jgi:hypothetical protein
MSAMLQDSPAVLQAYEEFQQFKSNPEMREKVRARERFLNDQRLKIAGARREGLAEGEMKGEARKARETATMMKRKGLDNTLIAEVTGLPPSEIERLG